MKRFAPTTITALILVPAMCAQAAIADDQMPFSLLSIQMRSNEIKRLYETGNVKAAAPIMKQTVAILRGMGPEARPMLKQWLERYAALLDQLGKPADAAAARSEIGGVNAALNKEQYEKDHRPFARDELQLAHRTFRNKIDALSKVEFHDDGAVSIRTEWARFDGKTVGTLHGTYSLSHNGTEPVVRVHYRWQGSDLVAAYRISRNKERIEMFALDHDLLPMFLEEDVPAAPTIAEK